MSFCGTNCTSYFLCRRTWPYSWVLVLSWAFKTASSLPLKTSLPPLATPSLISTKQKGMRYVCGNGMCVEMVLEVIIVNNTALSFGWPTYQYQLVYWLLLWHTYVVTGMYKCQYLPLTVLLSAVGSLAVIGAWGLWVLSRLWMLLSASNNTGAYCSEVSTWQCN